MNELGFLFSCMVSLGCNNFIDNIKNNTPVPRQNVITNVERETINKIKNTTYDYIEPNKKIGETLENRKSCSKVEWRKFNGNDDLVLYRCHLTSYEKLFKDNIEGLKKDNKYTNLESVKIPKQLKQDILFDVRGEKPTPVHCEFKYNLNSDHQATVLHPYCFMLGYDSDYTESWNDIINSVIVKQVRF